MAIYGGPDIVTDGLVLHLDAANGKSYPGIGNVWYNLSSDKNNASLVNGASYSDSYKGTISLDGVNDYIVVPSNSDFTFGTSNFTIQFWIYRNNLNVANIIDFRTGNPQNTVAIYNLTNNPTLYLYVNGSNKISASNALKVNVWQMISLIRINNSTFFSINTSNIGNAWVDNTNYIQGPLATAYLPIPSNILNAKLGPIMVYKNKGLSSQEVAQNYNALKGRFGL